ncbi:homeodomain-interacting protein kinase 2-like [Mugil cephalus]|uniref:homeodomain-interacting protein kinase 2-like n=1 Tax=Mugil cephalus TaxID=48193 RepID=UPI001FB670CE|nr:homeodomain-interacting protein kinase 2-like [Mugil cephalus]
MVVDRRQQPLRVKIIDFGLACHVSDIVPGSSMQTLWYRAPEVMLGTDFDEAIDMWSLGVFAAELTLGYPLFYGFHEYDVMRFIVETLGQPPDFQLNSSQNTTQFFRSQGTLHGKTWKLKTADEFVTETGHIYRDTRIYHLSSLDVLGEMLFLRNKSESRVNLVNCVDLLKRMLEVDQYARIIPLKVLEHAFFTVEQQPDGTQDRDISSLRANVEEETPVITEQPLPQDDSTASKTTTPHEEICFTSTENEKPEDEEKEAAHSQLEVAPQTSSKTRSRLKKFFSWFKRGKEFSHH